MATDGRNLLTVLRNELGFLDKGGYRETSRVPWRPHFIFQDSPTCLNFDPTKPPKPCSECAMIQLVPQQFRARKIPCRYVPIGDQSQTIGWFYRHENQDELQAALGKWLRSTITGLEHGWAPGEPQDMPEIHVKAHFASASKP